MNSKMCRAMVPVVILLARFSLPAAGEPPVEWVDADTGHRVVRLSREPGSLSLYFHQNAYTAGGDKMVFSSSNGLHAVNLRTREVELVVPGVIATANSSAGVIVGRQTRQVYYTRAVEGETVVFATHLDTKATRRIGKLPAGGVFSSLNADETLLLGARTSSGERIQLLDATRELNGPDGRPLTYAERREVMLDRRIEQRVPMEMYTISTASGEIKTIYRCTDWLGHLQFSPTDPALIMFCHEGPWHKVDRLWTIRTDGTGLTKIHARTMNMEIAGHEFFGTDGRTIWYDLQTPRGEDFWVAGRELATGQRTWFHLQRDEWSVHFNVSPDGTFFVGDGGDSEMVAHAKDGKWIYLFHPQTIPDVAGIKAPNAAELVKPGFFKSERLVNMAKHDYKLEPNVTVTPDQKWVVFRSNMHGASHVYAVEIAKAK